MTKPVIQPGVVPEPEPEVIAPPAPDLNIEVVVSEPADDVIEIPVEDELSLVERLYAVINATRMMARQGDVELLPLWRDFLPDKPKRGYSVVLDRWRNYVIVARYTGKRWAVDVTQV